MALARWQSTIVDDAGNIQPGASVRVEREVPGLPLANIYSDRDGAVPLGNPFLADTEAFAAFHALGGAYRITATKGAFSRVWRYVGIGTAGEFDLVDAEGLAVVQSVEAGYALLFETETSAPPSAGSIRFNNADLSAATEAYVSVENAAGSDLTAVLLDLFDAARTRKDAIIITDLASNAQATFQVDGAAVDGSPAGYVTLAISGHSGATAFDAGPVNLQRDRAGADGQDGAGTGDVVGPAGGVVDNEFAYFNSTTGKAIKGSSLLLADDAAVRAATANRVLQALHLSTANALVMLTDEATVALNWTAGINFTLTLTTDRILGNPTNGIPGTWRTVFVISDGGPDELTFGNQYGGEPPTLDDITTTKGYLLSIYCRTASQFLVFSADGSPA